jgi:pilus assembly protein CpaF
MLMGLNGFSADLNAVRRFIANAVDIVVHLVRRPNASRAVATICEVAGSEDGVYLLREMFHSETDTGRRKAAS